jgi:DNA-binding MarR family transcriptional regulator
MAFGISADTDEKDVEYDIDDENFLSDFVAFSRDNQVLNEEQSAVVMMAIASGMLDEYEFYTSIIVTGGSSGGKSHMLNEVIFESLEYANDVHEYVYELTGGSDKAGIDDDEIDESRVAYFHELQKIPDEMLEFIKTVSEDGKFKYGRNVPDPDSDSGRDTVHVERDPLPVVFSFADENEAAAGKDQELRTRTVEVKVDENREKNQGVHDMKWGGENITLPESEHEYIRDAPDREHAVKAHLRDIPVDVNAVIPYGNGKFVGDEWRAAEVVRPLFNFARSESTRASANLAGLTMGSAVLNYHARDAACEKCGERFNPDEAKTNDYSCPNCDDADLHIIVNETDVGNIISCRETLLATTHGLTEKKFAVLDAIRERGGQANPSGTAVQTTKRDIIDEIQENDDIATLTKSEIEDILEELDEHLIINKKDNPEDRRENLYVYDPSQSFDAPNIYEHYDRFKDVVDPIRDQPIEQTVDDQLQRLNAKMDADALGSDTAASDGAESGQTGLDTVSDTSVSELSADAQAVAERLTETIDGCTIPTDVMEANSLKLSHMVGDTPLDRGDGVVRPAREPSGDDRVDGFMRPEGHFEDADDFNEVEERVRAAVEELRSSGVMDMVDADDGTRVELSL